MKLVYGGPSAAELGTVIDDAITKVIDGGPIAIVCPYIDPTWLRSVMEKSTQIRVITDVAACIRALSAQDREGMLALYAERSDAIRHLHNVHAKVILSSTRATLGSANFTAMGLQLRDELGVMPFETVYLAELRLWFAALWARAHSIDPESIADWARSLPAAAAPDADPFATFRLPKRSAANAKTSKSVRPAPVPDRVALLARYPGRQWAEQFFQLIGQMYLMLGVDSDDPRVVVSAPGNKDVYVTINNRWVLQHGRTRRQAVDALPVGVLLGSIYERSLDRSLLSQESWAFQPRSKAEEHPPSLVRFQDFSFTSNRLLMAEWKRAMREQLRAGNRSSNRKHHRPDLAQLSLDHKTRSSVFDLVAWEE